MNLPARFVLVGLGVLTLLLAPVSNPAAFGQSEATPTLAPRTWLPVDAFYTPPAEVPDEPGALLRSELLTNRILPEGARAWRILYTTTFPDGSPAVSAATVLAPIDPPPGPRPVITWEHGTVGIQQKCMPSLVSAPFEGVPALDRVVAEGWVLVATDYAPNQEGVHPYIIGEGELRSALDATRAARQMPELTLDERTVVWGHSQGGHAALWTGISGANYAPDVDILGVAALAPASNMERIMALHDGDAKGAILGSYLATGYSQYFPDVTFDDVVTPGARDTARQLAMLCQFDPNDIPDIQALTAQLDGASVLVNPPVGAFRERLQENAPNAQIDVPLLIAQGLTDSVIDPAVNDDYVAERCAAGQALEYWRVPGRDHGGIVAPGSPIEAPLIAWTQSRFAGEPRAAGCRQTTIE